jgi:hypothetical protein
MKHLTRLLYIAVIGSMFILSACGDDNGGDPEPENVPGDAIEGTWAATQDNAITGPAADQFTDFSITINATADQVSYTTTNSGDPSVFPGNGTFIVEASDNFETGAQVLREPDDVTVDMNLSQDGTVLTMSFTINIDAAVNGRLAGINGEYTFILNQQ